MTLGEFRKMTKELSDDLKICVGDFFHIWSETELTITDESVIVESEYLESYIQKYSME